MTFDDGLKKVQDVLKSAGYTKVHKPVNIAGLLKGHAVDDCRIIAKKDQYEIMYMEATSNWKGIATEVGRAHKLPCLVITSYGNSHLIMSTIRDVLTNSKPRHLVIDLRSNAYSLDDFAKLIRVDSQVDDFRSLDKKVQSAFDKFSSYKQAIDEFDRNLDIAIRQTRSMIVSKSKNNPKYDDESVEFLQMCKAIISDQLELDDVVELLLQHVMTYRIFSLLYDEHEFHTTNAVARSMESLVKTLEINMDEIVMNYRTVELVAESITDSVEKQDFLKLVYETFYAKYDPRNKDKWGIAYTPSEVVDFMVRSSDELLKMHFGKSLSDNRVTILDPATGTGTFITSILRHLNPNTIDAKYGSEIFANDISILAYYIAALNIENTYQEITDKVKEFENICWMDTLASGTKDFGKMTSYIDGQDNIKRISKQQKENVCLVIGNPPYKSVQVSYNDANPADKYPEIDKMISDTYVARSSAVHKSSLYDMYMRFMKWSAERIKGSGMVVFVSNNSFLDAKDHDGFRKSTFDEFDYIYTVNLKGNARLSGDAWHREGGKIFGGKARVGIAISFFIKTGEGKSELHYAEIDDYMKRPDKLKWLADNSVSTLRLRKITPSKDGMWINQTNNNFDNLVPVVDNKNSLFDTFTLGITSGKDQWAYDFSRTSLENKIKYLAKYYNMTVDKYFAENPDDDLKDWVGKKIKWTEDFFRHIKQGDKITYSGCNVMDVLYRPFVIKYNYYDSIVTHRKRKFVDIFQDLQPNMLICFPHPKPNAVFQTISTSNVIDNDCIVGTQCIPAYNYDDAGNKHSNVTKFGLDLFRKHYSNSKISSEDIFYYTYAIFNDPKYSKKYEFNLRRSFPRIPLSQNFSELSNIGKMLYNLHADFDQAKPYPLKLTHHKTTKSKERLILKKSKSANQSKILIDEKTSLENIPDNALLYKFSSQTALEWVLKFYKSSKNEIDEKSCDDPEIRKKFNTYKFLDHKERIIDLLCKVTTVSIETTKLRKKLEKIPWGKQPKWQPKSNRKSMNLKHTIDKNKKAVKKPKKKKPKRGNRSTTNKQKSLF